MKYLFIDTSTHDLTIALASDDKLLASTSSTNMNEHSKWAVSELKNIFAQANLQPDDINKIMVVNGPGSFTGVRIGVTIAKTYAWALKKDIIPVSSLLSFALGYDGYDYCVSVLDARRDCVYGAIYNSNYESILDEQYISIDKLHDVILSLKGNIIIVGDISIKEHSTNPIKIDVMKIVKHYKDGQSVLAHSLNPHYLKRVEAEEKLMGESK
ncbi:MAG: tRNA (adenosine(37)-N6)-threonylcarbamoyltransferase complex dimerization subunit type 1 TsaB [Bacilli bacterium]|jgi:tRNA threonylcarbamoyl adenosine modification protein YeaZ